MTEENQEQQKKANKPLTFASRWPTTLSFFTKFFFLWNMTKRKWNSFFDAIEIQKMTTSSELFFSFNLLTFILTVFDRFDGFGSGTWQWASAHLFRKIATFGRKNSSAIQFPHGQSLGRQQNIRQRAHQEWEYWQERARTPVYVQRLDQVQWGKSQSLTHKPSFMHPLSLALDCLMITVEFLSFSAPKTSFQSSREDGRGETEVRLLRECALLGRSDPGRSQPQKPNVCAQNRHGTQGKSNKVVGLKFKPGRWLSLVMSTYL